MKKYFYYLQVLLLFFVANFISCEDTKEKSETEKQWEMIINKLENLESVNATFVESLKNIDLTAVTGSSFTVFAIREQGSFTGGNILRHIVKGTYSPAQFTDGLSLTAVNGDILNVRNVGRTYINGVEITGEAVKADNSIIYFMDTALPQTPLNMKKVSFIVKECNPDWSPENNTSYLAASKTEITFYSENGKKSGTYQTDSNGILDLLLEVGNYTYLAIQGDKCNIYENRTDGGYWIAGIFTSPDEIETDTNLPQFPYQQNAVLGGLRFVDINGDALIDVQDKTDRAYLRVETDIDILVYIAPDNFMPTYHP